MEKSNEIEKLYKIHIDSKIADGIERISEIIKAILISAAGNLKISHTQAQIILSIDEKGIDQKSLEDKLALDPSTLSKSIKNLNLKRYIITGRIGKSRMIHLTKDGKNAKKLIAEKISKAVRDALYDVNYLEKTAVYKFIYKFIESSLRKKIINFQRMCSTCKFFRYDQDSFFCLFLRKKLKLQDLMINCPDHISCSLHL